MTTRTDVWIREYESLRAVQAQLKEFLKKRETILAQIARAHSELAAEPCEYCVVQVTTLIDGDGWYFEWECKGHYYPQGRCYASTCGWSVPLDVVHRELEAALAAAAGT